MGSGLGLARLPAQPQRERVARRVLGSGVRREAPSAQRAHLGAVAAAVAAAAARVEGEGEA